MTHKLATFTLTLVVASTFARAQAQTASTPDTQSAYVPTMTFEVASIRESKVDINAGFTIGGGFTPASSSTLRLINNTFSNLIEWAYGIDMNQFEGIPKDIRDAFYNVEAKSDSATDEQLAKLPKDQLLLEHQHMMQVLLAERFNLKTHWESRDGRTYDLIVQKPGKLQSTGAPPTAEELKRFGDRPIPPLYQAGGSVRGFEYIAHGASTTDIADMLADQFGHPVNDKTHLTGKYDFDLKTYQVHADDRKDDETNPWPPLETAIQDQLGLKLVPSHGPTRVLVIDHIEKPSPN
jgi:uncharacterized protein (TIGR03435 family)